MPRRATALEGLDDDHAAAAARTGMRECLRLAVAGAVGLTTLILRRRQVEQLTRSRDVLDAPAVGERTVVADAVETLPQDVGKKAAHSQRCHGKGPTSGALLSERVAEGSCGPPG